MKLQSAGYRATMFVLLVWLAAAPGCRRDQGESAAPQIVRTESGLEMVVIAGGWFEMGSESGEADESPVHKVWVASFLMDRHEVPQSQFARHQLPDPSHFKDPNRPLEQVNWTDAALYCNDRSRAEGLEPCYDQETWACDFDADGYRLPTEAEWEYACRAGSTTQYCFGDGASKLREYGWFSGNASGRTHPAAQKKPNRWGLYDMHGNVAEWCNDLYSESYYRQSPERAPKGPAAGRERVIRGGSWKSSAASCRSAYRASDPSVDDTCLASDTIGFRCVRKAPNGDGASEEQQSMGNEDSVDRTSKTGFLYDEIYLQHLTTAGHPESPRRLVAIVDRLKVTGVYTELAHLRASPCPLEWLTRVHTPDYVERARRSCEQGIAYLDSPDVPISSKSYEAAVMAAGGVLSAIDAVVAGHVRNAFCAVRPPGHHAMKDQALGFCIFNNVAIAARYIQDKHDMSKVLIVDWDVHHGNGTQAAFYDDPNVLYFSTHQHPFYPGTGSESERGSGEGRDLNINVPLPAGSGDEEYIAAFEGKLVPAALAFHPDFVLISAGFDAHRDDLLGGMKVTAEGFGRLTRSVKEIAERCCEGRLVCVLEGGYGLDGLAASVEAHVRVLME